MMRFLTFLTALFLSSHAFAGGDAVKLKKNHWPFEGVFGTVDRQAAQRGLQVYREVCAACHSLKRVNYRNLVDIGFSEAEAKAIAKEATFTDGPNDDGDMFERPGRLSDPFVSPYPSVEAARAANNGSYPPDLSLIVKARVDGANYLYSLLTGYREAPEGFEMLDGLYYNEYFPNHQIAMPQPLSEDMVHVSRRHCRNGGSNVTRFNGFLAMGSRA